MRPCSSGGSADIFSIALSKARITIQIICGLSKVGGQAYWVHDLSRSICCGIGSARRQPALEKRFTFPRRKSISP